MRFALLAAALAAVGCQASPLATLTRTGISKPDLSPAGALTLHVIRTDDLVSDAASLIAERLTHIVLKIEMDSEKAAIRVNDEQDISLTAGDGSPVHVIKAEALTLPAGEQDVDGTMMSVEDVKALTEKAMPRGVVSLEVAIKENEGESRKLISASGEAVGGSEAKIFDVFVRLLESEVVAEEDSSGDHVTMVHLPLLRIELTKAADKHLMRAWALGTSTIAAEQLHEQIDAKPFNARPYRIGKAGASPHGHEGYSHHEHEKARCPHKDGKCHKRPHHHKHHRSSFLRRMRCAGRYWSRLVKSAFVSFSDSLAQLAETAPFALIGLVIALKVTIVLVILAVVRKNGRRNVGVNRLEDRQEVEVVVDSDLKCSEKA